MASKTTLTVKRSLVPNKIFSLLCLIGACWQFGIMDVGAQTTSSVKLAWNPSVDTTLAGYRVYQGVASNTYTNIVQVGNLTNATMSGLNPGVTYFFAVTAYDSTGLESPFSNEISYTATNTSPPTILLTSPLNGAAYTAPATINFVASVVSNGHSITKVQFYNGSTLLAEVTTAPYSYAWNNVSAGSYSLTAKAVYDAGSTIASPTATLTVTNPPPVVAFSAPANGAAYQAPANVGLTANVTANGHTITKVQFYNSSTLLAEVTASPYTYTWNNVSAGSYSLTTKAVYDAGSVVSSSALGLIVTNATTTASNLIGYWTFDTVKVSGGTVLDSSGNGDNGMLMGTPLPSIVSGKIAQSVNLTNTSQLVSVPDSTALNLTGPFTVSAWVSFSSLPSPGQYPNVVAKLTSPSGYYGYGIFWNGTGVSGIIGPGSAMWYITSPYQPSIGVWNHYVSVFDGAHLSLYVNGALYSQVTATAPGSTATIPVKMGPHYSNPNAYGVINGMFDDVRIYNKALSGTDIAQLYGSTGSGCTYAISPANVAFASAGGSGSVGVTAGAGCSWTATSSATWITISAGASGSGNGTVNYSVAANTSTSTRTGTLTIAGQTFSVTQNGVCSYAITPTTASFTSSGGSGSVTVTAGSGCTWIATSSSSWIAINSGSAGIGNGTVSYSVAANTTTSPLTGTLTIAGQTFTISQAGGPGDTTPPSVSLNAPTSGSTLKGTVTLSASASDNVGVTKVEFYCDGTMLMGTVSVPPYKVLCNTTTLINGSHYFYAKAYDAAGNSATSASSVVTVRNPKK